MYIIRHEVAEYHQCGALYIIITEFFCTPKRDDMQKRAIFSLFLMIYTQASCVMIYHYSVMDKKSRINMIRLFWCGRRELNPYGKTTRPSNVRVCQFRHSRNGLLYYTQTKSVCQGVLQNNQKSFKKFCQGGMQN